MTNPAPATTASSAAALLAPLPGNPPTTTPAAAQDFLTVILQAITSQPNDANSRRESSAGAPPEKKPSAPEPAAADPAGTSGADSLLTSMILGLLANASPAAIPTPTPETTEATGAETALALETKGAKRSERTAGIGPGETGGAGATLRSKAPTTAEAGANAASQKQAAESAKNPAAPGGILPYNGMTGTVAAEAGAEETTSAAGQNLSALAEKGLAASVASGAPGVAPQIGAKSASASRPPSTGTSAALGSPRMNLAAEINETAGPTGQKLPPGLVSATSGAATATAVEPSAKGAAKMSLEFSWRETPAEDVALVDISSKTANSLSTAPALAAAPSVAPAQLDRLEQLISHQAATIRQSGADSMGVSLKLDANTELFLQLTTQNGQLQASLRCEKGSFTAQDTQWAQLQAALARQNVQLTPPPAATASGFGHSPQNQSRHLPPAREEWTPAAPSVPAARPRQQKNQNGSRKNWESWA